MTAPAARPLPKGLHGSLTFYRVMAFITGVVLLAGTIGLIVQEAADLHGGVRTGIGLLWLAHGYLYLLYVIATLNLGIKMRWHLVRIVLVAASGTIPTMSFVAEHYTTRFVRTQIAAAPPVKV
jgi:integral membrane protein